MGLKRVTIFGPGLIGGSVALSLRARSAQTNITIWGRSNKYVQEILERGLADRVTTDPTEAAENANFIIFCTPVGAMEGLATTIAPHLKHDAIVTDAGSVKVSVIEKLIPIFGDRFLGGHPMAGSERSGLAAARADLFRNAACILTPVETTHSEALAAVTNFWEALGSRVTTMSPAAHDRLVARLSHLPHAIAFVLVHLIADSLPKDASLLAGGSYRDGTRVAASDPSLWAGILTENRQEVIAAVHEMSDRLGSLAQILESSNASSLLDFLAQAKGHRDRLPLPSPEELP